MKIKLASTRYIVEIEADRHDMALLSLLAKGSPNLRLAAIVGNKTILVSLHELNFAVGSIIALNPDFLKEEPRVVQNP